MERRTILPLILLVLLQWVISANVKAQNVEIQKEKARNNEKVSSIKRVRPEWTSKGPFFEDGKCLYFTGGYLGGADYVLTLRLAKSEAIKSLLESIELKARVEFSTVLHGLNADKGDLGRYVTDAVGWIIDNLKVRGIRQNLMYYEQVKNPESDGLQYNAWVQLAISKEDYRQARLTAAKNIVTKTERKEDNEAKAKALELLEKLQRES